MYWNACTKRSVSSTDLPTGRSFIVICRRILLSSIMKRPLWKHFFVCELQWCVYTLFHVCWMGRIWSLQTPYNTHHLRTLLTYDSLPGASDDMRWQQVKTKKGYFFAEHKARLSQALPGDVADAMTLQGSQKQLIKFMKQVSLEVTLSLDSTWIWEVPE